MTAPIDPRQLRNALGTFVTGVTVMTTVDDNGHRYGLTVNSFSSVSLDPPLILWSLSNTAPSFAAFQQASRFVVNILAEDQVNVSTQFSTRQEDKFSGIAYRPGLGGIPVIEGCAAYLQCRKVAMHAGGDHTVFIGAVDDLHYTSHRPLAFGRGDYLVAEPHEQGRTRQATPPALAQLKAIRLASRSLGVLAQEYGYTFGVAVWGNRGPAIVRWEAPPVPFTFHLPVGNVLPILNSASGLAFAAFLNEELTRGLVIEAIQSDDVAGLSQPTEAQVRRKLAAIRREGLARIAGKPRGEVAAVTGLSAPVFSHDGSMVCALTVMGESAAFDSDVEDMLSTTLKNLSREMSLQLGWTETSEAQMA